MVRRKTPPPKPYVAWEVGGVCPVEGSGLTYDRHGWYFRAEGQRWRFGVGAAKAARRIQPETRWDGDGYDCVVAWSDGWYAEAVWPDPSERRWRMFSWLHANPASYMPRVVAVRLIDALMLQYEQDQLERRQRKPEPSPQPIRSPTWRTWDG